MHPVALHFQDGVIGSEGDNRHLLGSVALEKVSRNEGEMEVGWAASFKPSSMDTGRSW
jgi:hypothetical protein